MWLTLTVTSAAVLGRLGPDLSVGGFPSNAELKVAKDVAGSAARAAGSRSADVEMAQSVANVPLDVEGYRALGLLKETQGDHERARRLLSYAHMLTRRDGQTELWMIEESARNGDVDAVLAHYDHALRTSEELRSVLLPILAAASTDPFVAARVERLMSKRPPWRIYFAEQFVGSFRNPVTAASILQRLHLNPDEQRERGVLLAGVTRLVSLGAYSQALELSRRAFGQRPAQSPLSDGSFEQSSGLPPFTWVFADEPSLAAYPEPRDGMVGKNALSLVAERGMGGIVAKQLVLLHVGHYRLSGLAGDVSGPPEDRPQLVLRCVEADAEPFITIVLPASQASARFGGEFSVPPNCPAQWLEISLPAPNSMDHRPWVDDLVVRTD